MDSQFTDSLLTYLHMVIIWKKLEIDCFLNQILKWWDRSNFLDIREIWDAGEIEFSANFSTVHNMHG